MRADEAVLKVRNLGVSFRTDAGLLRAVEGVNLDLHRGCATVLVGESGCGKTVTALSLPGLLPLSARRSGEIWLDGRNLVTLSEKQLRQVRGKQIGVVFQDAQTALNPVVPVGVQLTEVLRAHTSVSSKEARQAAVAMLGKVGVPEPELRLQAYPFELSGGLKQRVMIAMALLCRPSVLIADEPTTALDVTLQAQILDLLKGLRDDPELRMAILFITHDMGVVADIAQEVMVMYAGQVVEQGTVDEILLRPRHPYTEALLRSVPVLGRASEPLQVIAGQPPGLLNPGIGCRFAERCSYRVAECTAASVPWKADDAGWGMRCIREVRP